MKPLSQTLHVNVFTATAAGTWSNEEIVICSLATETNPTVSDSYFLLNFHLFEPSKIRTYSFIDYSDLK